MGSLISLFIVGVVLIGSMFFYWPSAIRTKDDEKPLEVHERIEPTIRTKTIDN